MKQCYAFLVVCAVILGTTASAMAIDLRNEDQRDYQVQVKSSAMTKDIALEGRSMSIIICVGECEFYVPGVGKIAARGSDTVTIRHGRLVHEVDERRAAEAKPAEKPAVRTAKAKR